MFTWNVRSPPRSRTSACPTFYAPLSYPPATTPLGGCPTTTPIIVLLRFSWTCSSGIIKPIGKVLPWMPCLGALASQVHPHPFTLRALCSTPLPPFPLWGNPRPPPLFPCRHCSVSVLLWTGFFYLAPTYSTPLPSPL